MQHFLSYRSVLEEVETIGEHLRVGFVDNMLAFLFFFFWFVSLSFASHPVEAASEGPDNVYMQVNCPDLQEKPPKA